MNVPVHTAISVHHLRSMGSDSSELAGGATFQTTQRETPARVVDWIAQAGQGVLRSRLGQLVSRQLGHGQVAGLQRRPDRGQLVVAE